ncbi:DNA-directed RNA polymerase [Candidatus Woesearchaeota archaeon]|nr:DNA-directed RNA polymerase [Candidatus Woesearchaeota archaeon]
MERQERSGFGRGQRDNFRRGPRRDNFSRGPQEKHKAVCSDCGNECEVPFEPKEGRPVYCGECYKNHKKF